jgi:hypothetical protein
MTYTETISDRISLPMGSLKGLLEDPAIGTWATEAASERRISPLDALGLLALALSLDSQR